MNELIKLTKARQALAEAKTLSELKEIKDIAKAVRAYTIAKGLGIEMKNEASEIEIRAIREMGKLIEEKQKTEELASHKTARKASSTSQELDKPKTLSEIGITKKESSTSKNIASISDEKFESIITDYNTNKKPLTKTAVLRNIAVRKIVPSEMPKDCYRIIYADPPWQYSDKREYAPQGAAENHYPTMNITELCEMKLPKINKDAVLFIWTTSPILEDAFDVIRSWGFKYKASFIWDKVKHNMGHYNSVRHEFLLIATKGSCLPDNIKLFDSVQSIEKTNIHSEKPEQFREIIDILYPKGNRIELFARKKITGWDNFGNQL